MWIPVAAAKVHKMLYNWRTWSSSALMRMSVVSILDDGVGQVVDQRVQQP